MSKRRAATVLLLTSGFLFVSDPLGAQNGGQAAQPAASREAAVSLDEQIAMLRSDLR